MRADVDSYIGKKFNELTIQGYAGRHPKDNRILVWCRCDCGKEKAIRLKEVKSGKTKSCGCRLARVTAERNFRHGYARRNCHKERLYAIWSHMRDRCYGSKNKDYKDYGARGIKICAEWLASYENFREWAYSNGYDENAKYGVCTLDRIDVNGNYEPSNCRWADLNVQANNKRKTIRILYDGETHTISEWADIVGIDKLKLRDRYYRGYRGDALFYKGRLQVGMRELV